MSETAPAADETVSPHFLFRLADTLLLCPATHVEAVTSFDTPVPLPRVPPHILGLVTYDQRALVLLDLGRFLALPGEAESPRTRTLVVTGGPYRVGLPVQHALGVIPVALRELRRGAHVFTGRLAPFVQGEVDTPTGLGAVLDIDGLLEAARA